MHGVRAFSLILIISLTLNGRPQQSVVAQNAPALQHIARYGRGTVTDVALSPDGKTLAVDGSAGTWLYDVTALNKTPRLMTERAVPNIVSFPSRHVVASVSGLDQRAWDAPPPCKVGEPCGGTGGGGGGEGPPPTGYGTELMFSPDGAKLLVNSSTFLNGVRLWDIKTGLGGNILDAERAVGFSADSQQVIGTRNKWDIATHQVTEKISGFQDPLVISPDHKTIVIPSRFATINGKPDSDHDGQHITLVDLATGTRRTIRLAATHVAFSPDSRLLAISTNDQFDDKGVHVLDVESGQERYYLPETQARSTVFSADSKLLALIARDKLGSLSAEVWDIETKTRRSGMILAEANDGIVDLAFTHDGRTLAVAYSISPSNLGLSFGIFRLPIRLWDVETGKLKKVLANDSGLLNSRVIFTPNGIGISVDIASVIRLWDLSTGLLVGKITGYGGGLVKQVAYSVRGKLLVDSGDTFTEHVNLIDLTTGDDKLITASFGGAYLFGPDGLMFTASTMDRSSAAVLALWHLSPTPKFSRLPEQVSADQTAFSADGKWIAVNIGRVVHVYDTTKETQEPVFSTEGSSAEITFSPDSSLLAVRGSSGAQVWDIAAQRVILQADLPGAQLMRFSLDSSLLALVDGVHIGVWEMATGGSQTYTAQCATVKHIAFVPHSSELMIACDNKEVSTINLMLANAQQGIPLFTQFSASPDGKLFTFINPVGSAFYLDRAAIWDSANRKPAADLSSLAVAFSPDGKQVAVGSDDGAVDVWEIVK